MTSGVRVLLCTTRKREHYFGNRYTVVWRVDYIVYVLYCFVAKPTVLNVKSAVGWIREYFIENDYYARVRTFSRFLCRLRTTE